MRESNEDFKAIATHIRDAHVERSAYLGTKLGEAVADFWLACSAAIEGASAGLEEHRRRRTVADARATAHH